MGERADVCLLLEGTYPYVRGGVSSWVHQLVTSLPELTFSLVFLGGRRSDYEGRRYQMPDNVIHLETHYLNEPGGAGRARPRAGRRARLGAVADLHESLRVARERRAPGIPQGSLARVLCSLSQQGGLTREDFQHSPEAWQYLRDQYLARCPHDSFVDYFWTLRTMHAPLFQLADIARQAPEAHVFHTISTGYAGFLGALLASARSRPLILSEHGIYTKERAIDLAQATWIPEPRRQGLSGDMGYLRRLWVRFFEGLGRITYQVANPIVSLYEGNRQRQIADGAPAERTVIVPNGVNLPRFAAALERRPARAPRVAGFIGRLVPIKDVKTFIRAMRTVCNEVPDAEGWIIGSSEEEPAYAAECVSLIEGLGLCDRIKLLGFQDVAEILPRLGLVALTSISEALPLVVLEGFAAGVPAVTTDVGACRELIEGRTPEDQALGHAGAVVSIADPVASGRAMAALLTSEPAWQRAQQAALARVRRFYTEPLMMGAYRDIYAGALAQAGAAGAAARLGAG